MLKQLPTVDDCSPRDIDPEFMSPSYPRFILFSWNLDKEAFWGTVGWCTLIEEEVVQSAVVEERWWDGCGTDESRGRRS
jgi:hypothetical protein